MDEAIPVPGSFTELAQDVVRRALRSVIFLDDEWPTVRVAPPGEVEPEREAEEPFDDAQPLPIEVSSPRRALAPERSHRPELLDFEQAALEAGLLFTGLRFQRKPNGEPALDYVQLARQADILVLDWDLAGDQGQYVKELIRERHRANTFCFICIFTGQGILGQLRQEIRALLHQQPTGSDVTDFTIGPLIFALRSKPGSADPQAEVVEPGRLPEAAIAALARQYGGLLQLTLLELTTQVRERLPVLLGRFDRSYDAPLLWEAAVQHSPLSEGGAATLRALLLDEVRAELERAAMESPLSVATADGLASYRQHLVGSWSSPDPIPDTLITCLRAMGLTDEKKLAATKLSSTAKLSASLQAWAADPHQEPALELKGLSWTKEERAKVAQALISWLMARQPELAPAASWPAQPLLLLDALLHQRSDLPDQLEPGTVLRQGEQFWVCITPACDAAEPERIGSVFAFLQADRHELLKVNSREAQDYLPIRLPSTDPHPGQAICLVVTLKPILALYVPHPQLHPGAPIPAWPWRPGWSAEHPPDPTQQLLLEPVAQLRPVPSQALANRAAALLGQVGLERVETIRKSLLGAG